jgi:superfamily II DNA or RNA helicase
MRAVITDNRWIHLENVPPDIDELMYEHFSAKDRNARYIDNVQEQSWDGVYRKYNRKYQKLAKAYLSELIKLCERYDVPLDVDDVRNPSKYPMYSEDDVRPDLLGGITLMDHQIEGLKTCAKKDPNGLHVNEIGTLFYTTGSGKTELICGIAKLLNCPTVIVAEETVVVDQIKQRLELRDVINDVGVFYAGQSPDGQLICVGSLASLMSPTKIKRKKNEKQEVYERKVKAYKTRLKHHQAYRKILDKCELLMVDEADKAATNKQYRKLILQYTNSRYLYGFTGTLPMEEDELDRLNLQEVMGSVIAKSDRRYLEKIGRIIPVKYIMTVFGENNKDDKSAFDIAVKELIEQNIKLHNKIKQIIDNIKNDNFLVLVENLELGRSLEEIIPNSKFIYGTTPKKVRNKALKEFEDKKLRILIGSKILKRGLDLKGGVDNLILCASSKKDSDLEQKVGRAVRLNSRGWARVFDFMFINNHYLYKHSRRRLKRMVQLGYPTMVVTSKEILDGKRVIKKGFNLFRYV